MRQPDILVINSGLHDARTPTQHHIEHLEKAADKLRDIADKGTKVSAQYKSSVHSVLHKMLHQVDSEMQSEAT